MVNILLVLLLFSGGINSSVRNLITVDVIELNHYTNSVGHEISQFVFWQWIPSLQTYYPLGWSLSNNKRPRLNYGWYEVEGISYRGRIRIRSKIFIQSWTDHDVQKKSSNRFKDYKPKLMVFN